MKTLVWLLIWLGVAAAAWADESGITEEHTPLQVEIARQHYALEAFIARPAQGSRFPIALIVHGAAESDCQLRDLDFSPNRQWARSFATRGWLAASVARRGYGKSEGAAFLKVGTCREPAAAAYFDHQAEDVEAALQAISKRADADPSRVLLVGKSVGGALVLDVASRRQNGITAVINVSGGLSAYTPQLAINAHCGLFQSDVVWNFARFGAASHIPTLWLYAENDPWFSPAFVGRLRTAYTAAGGRAELEMLPAFAPDGHRLFNDYDGQMQLLPLIDAFLRRNDLPTWDPAFADRLLAAVQPAQRNAALQYLQEAPAQKALAVGDGDSSVAWWGDDQDSVEKAKAAALRDCAAHAQRSCHIVAVNFGFAGEQRAQATTMRSPP
jgi:dienelactone hydrolase